MRNLYNQDLQYFVNTSLGNIKKIFKAQKNYMFFLIFKDGYELALQDILGYLKLCNEKELSKEIENILINIRSR